MVTPRSVLRHRHLFIAALAALAAFASCKLPSPDLATGEHALTAAQKVSELSTEVLNDSSAPDGFQVVNGKMMFFSVAGQLFTGLGLYRSDGTAAGTQLVRDLDPRVSIGHGAPHLVVLGTRGYWIQDGALWVTDATAAGTTQVAAVTDPLDFDVSEPVVYNGAVWFGAHGALYRSDGTAAGTQIVAPFDSFGPWQEMAGKLYFTCEVPPAGFELCVTDGTAAGTSMIKDIFPGIQGSSPIFLGIVGTKLLFSAVTDPTHFTRGLWVTDGTAAGTRELIAPPPFSFQDAIDPFWGPAVVLGGQLYVPCYTLVSGRELCKTDGTPAGTTVLDDVIPDHDLAPVGLVALGSRLFFIASTAAQGVELWTSDGTVAGTSIFIDLLPGPQSGFAGGGTLVMGGALYFAGKTSIFDPSDLWKTDGTVAGTSRVARILLPGRVERAPLFPVSGGVLGNQLFFVADDGDTAREPWITDGTGAGTHLVKDLSPTRSRAEVFEMRAHHGAQYLAVDSFVNRQLWKTDGTAAGTAAFQTGGISELTSVGHWLYYQADTAGRNAVWKTEGAAPGIEVLPVSLAEELQALGTRLVFAGTTPNSSVGLWQSDGTPAGTALVDPDLVNARHLGVANGRLWLTALHGGLGNELWTSDGTSAGTRAVKDIRPGFDSSEPSGFVALDGQTLFAANDGVSGFELWKTDGSDAGTVRVADLSPGSPSSNPADFLSWNGMVLFTAAVGGQRGIWKTDGTTAGTVLLKAVAPARDFAFVPWGSHVFFAAADAHGSELWRTDGTPAGTVMAADLYAGALSSNPGLLVLVGSGGPLVFAAEEPLAGREVWKLSQPLGTPELVADIAPGAQSSRPTAIGVQGSSLLITADAGTGYALWKIDGVGADDSPPTVMCPSDVTVMTMNRRGVAVTFPPPTAIDSSGIAPIVTSDRSSGTTFPVGTTRVNVTATDGANNASRCSFSVEVILQAPPIDAGPIDGAPDAAPDAAPDNPPPDAGSGLPSPDARPVATGPDAGNPDVPGNAPGGCGCGAAGAGSWSANALVLAFAAALVLRRPRRRLR